MPTKMRASVPRTKTPTATPDISSPDKVVDAINRGIMSRRYGPGHRLVEADLAGNLNVSRGTIREALKKLAAQGVVRLIPHRGAAIRPLSRDEAVNLLQVLEVLCGLAARLAAEKIDAGDARRRFAAAADLLSPAAMQISPEQFLANRGHYYMVMFEIAGNVELDRLMPISQIHLFRSQFQQYLGPRDLSDMQKEYREISEAVLAGHAAAAESRMRKHMRRTLDRIEAAGDDAFGPQP
jgi:DNA-binding GntR family transcriptional regulator